MRYWPVSSVTPVRTLVISAGLDASIVTPGSTAPDVSRTAPARLCALARLGIAPTTANTTNNRSSTRFMRNLHNRLGHEANLGPGDAANGRDYGPFQRRVSRKEAVELGCTLALRHRRDAHHGAILFHAIGLELGREVQVAVWPLLHVANAHVEWGQQHLALLHLLRLRVVERHAPQRLPF